MAANRTTLEIPSFRLRGLRLRDLAYRHPTHGESWSHRRAPSGNRLRIDAAELAPTTPHALASRPGKSIVRLHSQRAIGQCIDGTPTGLWTFFDATGNKDC